MENKSKKIGFMNLLLIIGVLPLLMALIISTIVSALKMKDSLEDGIYSKLNVAAESLSTYYEYDIEHNDLSYDNSYVDSLKEQNIELTVFEGNTRVMTSIYKDGTSERNIGTSADAKIYANVSCGEVIKKNGVNIGGEKYYVVYRPMYNGSEFWGMAFAGTPQGDVRKSIEDAVEGLIILAVILLVLFITIVILIANQIKKSIKVANETLNTLSNGEISGIYVKKTSPIRELNNILSSTDTLKNALNDSISTIKNNSETLNNAIEEVSDKTKFNVQSVEQISDAINEVTMTSQSVSETASNLAIRSGDLGNQIEQLSENVIVLSNASQIIKDANNEAINYINTVLESSKKSVEAVNQIATDISNTDNAVAEINKALEVLEDIASETKLLSLNASIEAARAGEMGRGFAVVADNVKTLANSSSDNVEKITEVINKIISYSTASVESAKYVNDVILEQQDSIVKTQEKFKALSVGIETTNTEIDSIAKKTEELDKIKADFIESTESLSAISEELGASTEEVNASCQTVLEACGDTQNKTSDMSNINSSLVESVSFFK